MSKNQALAADIQKAAGIITARLADAQRDIQSLQILMNNNEELLRQKLMQAERERAEQERLEAAREQERLLKEEQEKQAAEAAQQEQKDVPQAEQPAPEADFENVNQKIQPPVQDEKVPEANSKLNAQSFEEQMSQTPSENVQTVQAEQDDLNGTHTPAAQNTSEQSAESDGEISKSKQRLQPGVNNKNTNNPTPVKGQESVQRSVQSRDNTRRPAQGAESTHRPVQGENRSQNPGARAQASNNAQGRQNAQRSDQAQQGARPAFGNRSQGEGRMQGARQQGGNRPQPQGKSQGGRGQGALKIPAFDASLPTEKGRVSNYDPNKKLYSREHEERRQNKKEGAPRQRGAIFDDDERIRSRKPKRKESAQQKMEPIKIEHAVMTTELISIKDLSEKLGKPATDIIKKLFLLGIMATINNEIDYDTAALVATDFGIDLEQKIAKTFEETLTDIDAQDEEGDTLERPPVVTIMGHVDHGKTSLLDAIRSTNVTAHEAGGITQHIGAYTVNHNGRVITFLDTPGHEAFTSMRARGAQVTDIAILVVAADDGVMPQTIEAINHATAAKVPIIVAINKMDKPTANPERVKQELTNHGILPEEWGGDAIIVPVSAVTGEGLSDLLEMILLVADVNQYKANPAKRAKGTIVEARLDKGRGPVATVLVQNGTLRVGDTIVAGTTGGRVRAMMNDKGERVEEAGPSMPVEVLGFSDVPDAGDILYSTDDDRLGRQVVQERRDKLKADQLKARAKASLDDLFNQIKEGDIKELNLIVKADVQGSVEAVRQALEKLSNEEVRINVIHGAVGAIKESDVILASASNAIIIGFNVRPDAMASAAAEAEKVDMRMYRVIYNAIEDIENAMKGMLDPEFKEVVIGHAEVRTTFKVPGAGIIAGAYVTDGKIQRNAGVRLLRDNIVIHEGTISSLKRFKDDVKEVAESFECGIGINNYNDIKENDVIEAFVQEQIKR